MDQIGITTIIVEQKMKRFPFNDIIDCGHYDLPGVHVSMATQDAIARLTIERGPATGTH